jgi:hypothetical protein
VRPQPQALPVFKEERQGGRGSEIDGAQRFGNCPASCALTRRQPLWLSQRIVGGTDGTCG